jgi:hypothetical protein
MKEPATTSILSNRLARKETKYTKSACLCILEKDLQKDYLIYLVPTISLTSCESDRGD